MRDSFPRMLQVMGLASVMTLFGGCKDQPPADQTQLAQTQTSTSNPVSKPSAAISRAMSPPQAAAQVPPPQSSPIEAPPATPDAALQRLGKNSGLEFSAGTKVASFGDGGIPDPTIGFFEWLVISPTHLALPNGRQIGDNDVMTLPLSIAVQLVESKMTDTKIENPQAAFSMGWQKNGFAFNGTWVRAQGADYLIVQQTRN